MGEKNFDTIFEDIRNFINPTNKPDFPLLYTMSDHIPCVDSILTQFALEVCHDEKEAAEMFSICAIDQLFYRLKKNTDEPLVSHHISKILLDKDHYEHRPGLACKFHEDEDIPRYCALAMVTRWAYTVCDNICGSLNIQLIPGKHVPMESNVNYKLIKPGDDDDPTNVWIKTGGKKNRYIPKTKENELDEPDVYEPDVYETVYEDGKPVLRLKEETPNMVENPYARNNEKGSDDDKKPIVQIKAEDISGSTLLPFAISKIRESDSLREDNKKPVPFNDNIIEVIPNQIIQMKEEDIKPVLVKDEVNAIFVKEEPEEIVYEDRYGSNNSKRRFAATRDGVKIDPSPIKKRYGIII